MKRTARSSLVAGIIVLAATVRGDTLFEAIMSGNQEVPTNSSPATGFGTVVLNTAETQITVNASFSGLTGGPATAGHIHGPAGPGTNAGVIFPFTDVPAATSGSIPQQTFAITPAQVGLLKSNLLYINIHNGVFLNGEIRGQLTRVACPEPTITVSPAVNFGPGMSNVVVTAGTNACVVLTATNEFGGTNITSFVWRVNYLTLSPDQELSGTGTGLGSGTVTVSSNALVINVSFQGLSSNSTAAHIHGPAGAGTNAGVLYPLTTITTLGGTSGTINGTVPLVAGTGGLTIAQQFQQISAGLWYINIHTATNPDGEIRGQINGNAATGAVANVCLPLGCQTITVTSSNAGCITSTLMDVCVATPCEAIDAITATLLNAQPPEKHAHQMVKHLDRVCEFIESGKSKPAANKLHAFQYQVRAQVSDAELAQRLSDAAQAIIDALNE